MDSLICRMYVGVYHDHGEMRWQGGSAGGNEGQKREVEKTVRRMRDMSS